MALQGKLDAVAVLRRLVEAEASGASGQGYYEALKDAREFLNAYAAGPAIPVASQCAVTIRYEVRCARRAGHERAGERRIEANEILGTGGCVADPKRAAELDAAEDSH
jgi:hypothetical protein